MTNGNEPINPEMGSIGDEDRGGKGIYYNHRGLTKREYFAAAALQGLIVKGYEAAARDAVRYADALIDALNAKRWSRTRAAEVRDDIGK